MEVGLLYEKDKNLKPDDVRMLQEWMSKESHLPKITDYQMIIFLNSCYYSVEATKLCIENYFTIRTHCPEFFSNRNVDAELLKIHLNSVLAIPLPRLTPEKYLVCYVKLNNSKTDTFSMTEAIKLIDMSMALYIHQLGPHEGLILLVDGHGLLLGHVLKMNLLGLKKYFYFVQEAMPVRLKQIHVVNVNSIVEKFINLVRQCLKKELQEQMYCHSKMETLYRFIPKNLLPADYGGEVETLQELHDRQITNIKENIKFLIEDEEFKSDETKRVGKPRNIEEFNGIQGTFKKLDID